MAQYLSQRINEYISHRLSGGVDGKRSYSMLVHLITAGNIINQNIAFAIVYRAPHNALKAERLRELKLVEVVCIKPFKVAICAQQIYIFILSRLYFIMIDIMR